MQRAARAFRGRWRVGDRSRPAVVAEMLAQWETCTVTQSAWPGTPAQRQAMRARVEALLDELRRDAAPFMAAWLRYCYRLAITLLAAGRDHAREARRRAMTLNYGDLLEVAARLLREDRTVRAALQQKYRWLFVDEFQDTNALQAEVIVLLASNGETGDDWTRARLRPGALFVVGDPKQSIYRFAGADIETYARVREIVEASGGRTVELTTSFRALPLLCDWANRVFGRPEFFPPRPTPQQPAYCSLRAVKAAGPAASSGLRTLSVSADVPRERVPVMDAAGIARFIRAEVDAGRRHWRDFLILTRIRKNLPRYTAALDELHIPATVSGAVAFTQSREVQLLAGLLRALADPDDGVALVGVLRGPLFGRKDSELFAHRMAGLGFYLSAPLPDEATGPVVDAIRRLQVMYRWTRSLPAAAAVDRILEATGILARAAAVTPGAAEAGDLLHALDRVRRVAEEGGSLAAAADVLERDLTEPEVESIALEPGRQDVVRVMNLHKAKGLEAPVVFLADPVTGASDRVSVRVVREGRHALGFFLIFRRRGRWQTLLAQPDHWDAHEQAELAYVQAEGTRLLYVAATRAAELLVVSRWAAGKGAQPWAAFDPHLTQARELAVSAEVSVPSRPIADLGPAAREAAGRESDAAHAAVIHPSWRVESVTATTHKAGPVGRPLQAGRTREPDTGVAWGTLVHGLLEAAMRGPHRDGAHLERIARWLTMDNAELRRVVPEALDTVERVMTSDFWQRAMAAEERQVEMPCAARVDGRVLFGLMDLVFRDAPGWHVIDYKTDQATVAQLLEWYGEQAQLYVDLLARLTGTPVVYGGLYSVRAAILSENVAPTNKRIESSTYSH